MALYTREIIEQAWEANRKEKRCVYHHATQEKVIEKCIDLLCRKPLHDIKNKPQSDSSEKWLEAYIIQLAKHSNQYQDPFQLPGVPNCYYFLDSQRNFEKYDGNSARPLDCLLFEPETSNLIVLELKADRLQREIAIEELDYYTKKVLEIKNEIADVFGLGSISGVEGYIVWPGDDRRGNELLKLGNWGLIGYEAKEIIKQGKLVQPWNCLNFQKYRGSKVETS